MRKKLLLAEAFWATGSAASFSRRDVQQSPWQSPVRGLHRVQTCAAPHRPGKRVRIRVTCFGRECLQMIRWRAKVISHHVSDSLLPKEGRARSDFIESTAHHRGWSAKHSGL